MEAVATEPDVILEESSVDIPQRGVFVPCDACGHISYGFYIIKNGSLLSYCYHHSQKYNPKLVEGGATFIDYSDDLAENRTQGEP